MIISRMIQDPTYSIQPNRMGLTVGLVFHTPKFWSCRKYNFDTGGLWLSPPLSESTKKLRYEQELAHQECRWPYRHRSYKGYMYWIGPKRRYQLNYMGPLDIGTDRKWFNVFKHGRYVRWFDDGTSKDAPVERVMSEKDEVFFKALGEQHAREAKQIRQEMAEYKARREASDG